MGASKRFNEATERVDREKLYAIDEALTLLKDLPAAKFDESVDIAVRLGVDPKHADQMVRGAIVLPHGTGREVCILVFAKGDKEAEARDAGADHVGGDDLAKKIQEGWLEFDRVIATPDMMGIVGPLGKVLGPRGLMPSPRAGTVTPDVEKVISEYKAGKVEFRNDTGGNVHAVVGRLSFEAKQLSENIQAFINHIQGLKPLTLKGTYVRGISICATMSPGIQIAA